MPQTAKLPTQVPLLLQQSLPTSRIPNGSSSLMQNPLSLPHMDILSVSSKKLCSYCTHELGSGAAMIIENLGLFYHIDCFKCSVCHTPISDGNIHGTDVRVRNNRLHCQNCFSNEEGVKFSCVWLIHKYSHWGNDSPELTFINFYQNHECTLLLGFRLGWLVEDRAPRRFFFAVHHSFYKKKNRAINSDEDYDVGDEDSFEDHDSNEEISDDIEKIHGTLHL